VSGLLPLLVAPLGDPWVDELVDALTGPAFAAAAPTTLGVPSYDRTSPRYDPRRYWRGPTWVNTTWLVATGLRRHGRDALAAKLEADLVRLVQRSGLREYFHPDTGTGHGTSGFSWTAALLLHLLAPAR
jgi:glycogen debranching enzyme